jgi:hypothetical protein
MITLVPERCELNKGVCKADNLTAIYEPIV